MAGTKGKNPASGFKIIGISNMCAAALFAVFYILYNNAGGQNSSWFLIAAVASFLAGIGSFVVFRVFSRKFQS